MEEFSAKSLFNKIHKQETSEFDLHTYSRSGIPFIVVNESGRLSLSPESSSLIKQIPGNLSIISVCGPSKSGKSTLSNLLVSNSLAGFELSHDNSVSTEGVWLWAEPIRTKDSQILFLDCQASKFFENSSRVEMKLYTLIVLLSSCLVFNTRGVIDEESIRQLNLLMCFTHLIDYTQDYSNSPEDIDARISQETPKLVWVLRDFSLAIVDDDGRTLQAKEYMESLLSMPSFMGKSAVKNEKILKDFLKVFKLRECFTLPRPTQTQDELEDLDIAKYESLREAFRLRFEEFKESVLEHCPVKRFNGIEVTGFQLVTLVEEILEVLNDEETPNLYEVIDFATRVQYEEILHRAKEKFASNRHIDLSKLPYEESQIIDSFQGAKASCLDLFNLVNPKNADIETEMIESFQEFYQEALKMLLKANYSASEAFNISLLETLYRETIVKLDEGYYSNNFEELETDWTKSMHLYEKQAKGPGKFSALSEFSRTHQHGAFNKFFEEINAKYFEELEMLKAKDKDCENKLHEQHIRQARQEIINEHVN